MTLPWSPTHNRHGRDAKEASIKAMFGNNADQVKARPEGVEITEDKRSLEY